ncbi:hypothetical protein C5S39_06820 [Candidatus Methanophagaceae archaeon]|nr:hypothetical protein C5S39_06820 [Methanophagales archaeon]
MAPAIPSQFNFETLLSHTFPGFFLALGVFMLLDLLITQYDLTLWACGTIGDFLMVIGFIILVGTILGILIDGLQHTLEKGIFEKCQKFKDLEIERKSLYPSSNIKHFYYFTRDKEAFTHLTDKYYCYAEFYGNIAISLIAFSCIAPFYFRDILHICAWQSFILGCVVPLVLAGFCIWSSYETFLKYHRYRIDLIYGILQYTKSIEVIPAKKDITVNESVVITAQLKEWTLAGLEDLKMEKYKVWKASDVPSTGVKITFETSGEYLSDKEITEAVPTTKGEKIIQMETKKGVLSVWFRSNEPGTFTVTASSKDFISGNVVVNVEKTE